MDHEFLDFGAPAGSLEAGLNILDVPVGPGIEENIVEVLLHSPERLKYEGVHGNGPGLSALGFFDKNEPLDKIGVFPFKAEYLCLSHPGIPGQNKDRLDMGRSLSNEPSGFIAAKDSLF